MDLMNDIIMSVEAMALHYGLSPNTRAVFLGPKTCRGCRLYECLMCPLHSFAMERLLRKYCDYVERAHLESFDEKYISKCLKNFGSAFLGISHQDFFLQHGRFNAHHVCFVEGKQVTISQNEELKKKFSLEHRPSSVYIRFPCVFRRFGISSFFIAFDDGKFFLLGSANDAPGRDDTFYKDFIAGIDMELTAAATCAQFEIMNMFSSDEM